MSQNRYFRLQGLDPDMSAMEVVDVLQRRELGIESEEASRSRFKLQNFENPDLVQYCTKIAQKCFKTSCTFSWFKLCVDFWSPTLGTVRFQQNDSSLQIHDSIKIKMAAPQSEKSFSRIVVDLSVFTSQSVQSVRLVFPIFFRFSLYLSHFTQVAVSEPVHRQLLRTSIAHQVTTQRATSSTAVATEEPAGELSGDELSDVGSTEGDLSSVPQAVVDDSGVQVPPTPQDLAEVITPRPARRLTTRVVDQAISIEAQQSIMSQDQDPAEKDERTTHLQAVNVSVNPVNLLSLCPFPMFMM